MPTVRSDAGKTVDQLTAERNQLFEQLLEHPSDVALINEIRLIQTRMAELTSPVAAVRKSDHNQ
jgi:hypothetical protein